MKNSHVSWTCLTLFVLIFLIKPYAQTTESEDSGYHEHDGFFLRLQIGPSYAQTIEKDLPKGDLKLSGTGMQLLVQIGGTVSNNLILYGVVDGTIVSNPELSWGELKEKIADTKLSVSHVGGGLTYYFMPVNIFFAVSAYASRVTLEYENKKGTSELGFGFSLSVGKEWWISGDWALGAAIIGHYSQVRDVETMNSTSIGIMFSASYN